MFKIIPILHNIRSIHNVGSILRTADGLGLDEVWVSGYTPYPHTENDQRLPHVSKRASEQIAKTSLGAEQSVSIKQFDTFSGALECARSNNFGILALEQAPNSKNITTYKLNTDSVLILGNEVEGLDKSGLQEVDDVLEIQMYGKKESFNVSVAAAIALFSLTSHK